MRVFLNDCTETVHLVIIRITDYGIIRCPVRSQVCSSVTSRCVSVSVNWSGAKERG